jgi:hypothetical protein
VWLERRFWMSAVFQVLYWLPLVAVSAAMPRLLDGPPATGLAVPLLYLLFGVANLLLLHPCADIWHVLMLLPAFLPLAAHHLDLEPAAAREGTRRSPGRRLARGLTMALLLLASFAFVAQLRLARVAWSADDATFDRATGISHPSPKFRDAAALVRYLDSEPERPVFALSGEQMLYFLSARASALEQEEYVIHMIAVDAVTPENAARLADQRRMVRRLKAARPLVIDYAGSPVGARIRRTFPTLDRYVQTRCKVARSFGGYQVLDCAPPAPVGAGHGRER